jgi:hypothetical protein
MASDAVIIFALHPDQEVAGTLLMGLENEGLSQVLKTQKGSHSHPTARDFNENTR